MNITERDEKLMEFIYDKYKENSSFQTYGEFASTLVSEFEETWGIGFGEFEDSGVQLEDMQRLMEKGWIETVTMSGRRIGKTHLNTISRIKPTNTGILFVEGKRQPWIKRHGLKLFTALTEGIIRGVKKL